MPDDILVLDIGNQSVNRSDGTISTEIYWICTTKAFFNEVKNAYDVQGEEGINCAIDVTYRLSASDNNLGLLGTTTNVMNDNKSLTYSFVPFMWFFCATEAAVVYEAVYRTIIKWAKLIHDIDFKARYVQQDHCAASASAAISCFPLTVIADCYPHLVRKTKDHKSMLVSKDAMAGILEDITRLHLVASKNIFTILSIATIKRWEEQGERVFAHWFKSVYLHERWRNFYIASLPVGVQPDNNSLESLNRVIKNWIGTKTTFAILIKVSNK